MATGPSLDDRAEGETHQYLQMNSRGFKIIEVEGPNPLPDLPVISEDTYGKLVVKNTVLRHCSQGRVFSSPVDIGNLLKDVTKIIPAEGYLSSLPHHGCVFHFLRHGDKTYKEMLYSIIVLEHLRNLAYTVVNRTSNFPTLIWSAMIEAEKDSQLLKMCSNVGESNSRDARTFLVLKLAYSGVPITEFDFSTPQQLKSVMIQVLLAIAAAECAFQFEHHNLTLNNVLIKETMESTIFFTVNSSEYIIPSHGVKVTIAGLNFARIKFDNVPLVDMPIEHTKMKTYFDKERTGSYSRTTYKPGINVVVLKAFCEAMLQHLSCWKVEEENRLIVLEIFRKWILTLRVYHTATELATILKMEEVS